MTRALDLGCGEKPKNFFNADEVWGCDVRDDLENNIYRVDLALDKLPFDDNFFDFVTAHDVLEHIPRLIYTPMRRLPFIEVMNEISRILKVGGRFFSSTPVYPHPACFQDPTHVNFITDKTFLAYFDIRNNWAKGYGYTGRFQVAYSQVAGEHLNALLIKV
jgi:SAM-dependent methyltransferase